MNTNMRTVVSTSLTFVWAVAVSVIGDPISVTAQIKQLPLSQPLNTPAQAMTRNTMDVERCEVQRSICLKTYDECSKHVYRSGVRMQIEMRIIRCKDDYWGCVNRGVCKGIRLGLNHWHIRIGA